MIYIRGNPLDYAGWRDAYLRPAMGRPNVTVETNAHVSRLVLEGGRVAGVRYVRDGATREARATSEVVVACGAVKTPQLLLLSGIGPADQLRAHRIPVVAVPGRPARARADGGRAGRAGGRP